MRLENTPASNDLSRNELSALADDVFKRPLNALSEDSMEDLHADIKIAIEDASKIQDADKRDAKLYQIRGMLLAAIDMLVDEGTVPKEEVNELYNRLGLSPAERSRIRGPSA